jgi:hypothetical protein
LTIHIKTYVFQKYTQPNTFFQTVENTVDHIPEYAAYCFIPDVFFQGGNF